MVRRIPRGMGSTLPSKRAPPSNIAARTRPPMISNSGCANQTSPTTNAVMPIQTAARLISVRMMGS